MIVLFRLAAFYFCRLPEFKAHFIVAALVWAYSAIHFLAVFGTVLSAWWHARSQRGKVDAKEQREKTTHPRTILAGVAAGLSMNFVMLLTFGVLGFGWNGSGILLQSRTQSSKLISVWTEVEPVSLVVSRPAPMIGGIIFFGIVHAYVYRWLSAAWPKGAVNRGI